MAGQTSNEGSPLTTWRERLGHGYAAMLPGLWFQTLKARIVIGALAALLSGMALTAWQMSRVAEVNILASKQAREDDEAKRTAGIIRHRVAEMQRALKVEGDQMDRKLIDDAAGLASYFYQRPVLRSIFSEVAVIGPDGRIRLLVDADGSRQPTISVADQDHFKRTITTRRALVSEPIASRIDNEPLVILTQPLSDAAGVWGLISGTLRLAKGDLISDLAASRDPDDSTLMVVTDRSDRILIHPHRARILESLSSEPRLASPYARWLHEGRPLARATDNWRRQGDVVAVAVIPMTDWHVWRATSRESLLAPLRAAQTDALGVAVAFAVAMGGTLLVFLAWQLRPLARLEARAAALLTGDDAGEWPQASGEIGVLAGTLRHVWAERVAAERSNAQILSKLSSVMSASPVGLAFSRNRNFELVSAECCRMLAYDETELVGRPVTTIFPAVKDYDTLCQLAEEAFNVRSAYEGEWQLLAADGRIFWARIRARPVVQGDATAGSVWSLYDISGQVAARDVLEHAVSHDALTGVLNRNGLRDQLAAIFSGQPGSLPASVVMLDLDHFKPVNDLGGHAAGDVLLKAVAQAIICNVRGSDFVARMGGDEFAILLPGCDQARAKTVAQKVRRGIAEVTVSFEGNTFAVSASLGVAELAASHEAVTDWLAAADASCYEAKRSGRNTVLGARPRGNVRLVVNDRADSFE